MNNIKSSRLLLAQIFGIYSALGCLHHGIGLILQGHGRPQSIVLETWTMGPIAERLGGEPGMTLIPDFWLAGLFTIILALSILLWDIFFIGNKHGGLVHIILTIVVLLTGGGFAPPVISLLAGVSALLSRHSKGCKPASNHKCLAAKLWPWVFSFSVLVGGFVFVIGIILTSLSLINMPDVFVNGFFYLILAIIYLTITAPAYDFYNPRMKRVIKMKA